MADTRYKGQGSRTTGHIADRPTGSDETEQSSRKTFGFTSDRQDHAVDATGKQQNTDPIKTAASGKTRFITVQKLFRPESPISGDPSRRRMRPCVLRCPILSHGRLTLLFHSG